MSAQLQALINLIPLVVGCVCGVLWIRALVHDDEEPRCGGEDCRTCMYRGTGCKNDPDTIKQRKDVPK